MGLLFLVLLPLLLDGSPSGRPATRPRSRPPSRFHRAVPFWATASDRGVLSARWKARIQVADLRITPSSTDGKWWWDGSKWVPVPITSTAPQPLHQLTASMPGAYQQMAPTSPAVYIYGPRTNTSAVASLVFGIVSWFVSPLVGGVLAIIFGHVARG